MVYLQPHKRIYTIKKHLIRNLYIYIHVTKSNPRSAQPSCSNPARVSFSRTIWARIMKKGEKSLHPRLPHSERQGP